jgi:uncharacterized protein (TIGR01244 family)
MHARMRMLPPLLAAVLAAAAFAAVGSEPIDRFYRVSDLVATGAQPTPEQVAELADQGFNAIIKLREESEFNDGLVFRAAREAGIRFVRVPVAIDAPTDESVDQFLEVTDEARLYPVFIYCGTGNRAAALWMIRRVLREGWELETAEAEARKAGLIRPETVDFVRGYIERHSLARASAS